MSYPCRRGGSECDGCGACRQEPEVIGECFCGEEIFAGEDYYNIEGELVHECCLTEWAEQYLVRY